MDQLESFSLLGRIQKIALIVGGAGVVAAVIGFLLSPAVFFQSYLLGYLYWVHLALGCLAVLMLQYLTGGRWGWTIRRILEAGALTLPLLAVLFVPLIFGLTALYSWTHVDEVAKSEVLAHKAIYLNPPFFLWRTLLYFIIWIGLAYLLNRWSRQQDQTGQPGLTGRLKVTSTVGIILFMLTSTFAAFDWMMSLEPEWFSSIYGVLFIAGQGLGGMALAILSLKRLDTLPPLAGRPLVNVFNDLGNFLLAFVSFWAYIAFSQFLIIWSGNLPEEIIWYTTRTEGSWQYVAQLLIAFHFALPFALLLSRTIKRQPAVLAGLAGLVLVMRLVDLFWLTIPALRPAGLSIHWLDLALPVGMGGLWLAYFTWLLQRRPLLPLYDDLQPAPGVASQEVVVHE